MDTYYHAQDSLLRERGTVRCCTSKGLAGCPSSGGGDSIHSDGAEDYIPEAVCSTVSRRRRKMLQPKRAAMYGSEVVGGWCDSTDESQCNKPRPVKQHTEQPHTPVITPRPVSAAVKPAPAPTASKSTRQPSSAATKRTKKPCTPGCGPCANCGTTTSPQWRRGNNEKPTVCNACGIRYQRTGSFAMQSEKKRAASTDSGAVSGGAKRCKTGSPTTSSADTCPANNSLEAVSHPASRATIDRRKRRNTCPANNSHEGVSRPADGAMSDRKKCQDTCPTNNSPEAVSRPAAGSLTDGRKRRRVVSPNDTASSNAASPSTSPSVSPSTADAASTPASPLWLDAPGANNAAGSNAYTANHHTYAGQQHVQTNRGRHSQSGSRLGPSPLGKVEVPAAPPASDAPVRQTTVHPVIAAPVPGGQVISSTRPFSAVSAVPLGNIPSTAAASGPMDNAAAGTAAAQAVVQPGQAEMLQLLSILAPRLGSIDAAIAYLMASAGGMAGVPGQVPAHIQR